MSIFNSLKKLLWNFVIVSQSSANNLILIFYFIKLDYQMIGFWKAIIYYF